MKNNRSTQDRKIARTSSSLVQIIRPDLIVPSGITELDRLCGGFKAGELTLVDGNSSLIATLPDQLCANTYRTFRSETIYIDAGMRANPYQIARYARLLELDQREVLQNVLMSRAFTVHQLSTILQDLLEPTIQHHSPRYSSSSGCSQHSTRTPSCLARKPRRYYYRIYRRYSI